MASTIQLKTGTSGAPSSLTNGEVAINVNDGLFYYGSGSGNDVRKLETFTNVTASVVSSSGHIFADRIAIDDGDSSFAGQVTVEGNIVANGSIIGDNATAIAGIKQIISIDFVSSSQLISEGNITASGNISASGDIFAARLNGIGTGITGINHDTLDNFVANEHVDHTSVTLSAGNGLSGGGDISANRSFAVDAAQTTITSVTNTGLKVGRATDDTYIDFGTDDKIQLKPANATALEVETTGIDITGEITASGIISASSDLSITGKSFFGGHITASGEVSASGNITAPSYTGQVMALDRLNYYITINSNDYFLGRNVGVESGDFDIVPTSPFSINDEQVFAANILPVSMSTIGLRSGIRVAGGGTCQLWITTGSRSDWSTADTVPLGFGASGSVTLGNGQDFATLDLPEFSINDDCDVVYVFVRTPDTDNPTVRITGQLYGRTR